MLEPKLGCSPGRATSRRAHAASAQPGALPGAAALSTCAGCRSGWPGSACRRWGAPKPTCWPTWTRCWASCIGSPAGPGHRDGSDEPAGTAAAARCCEQHAEALFGAAPAERAVRIMVTLPSEAAHDAALVARWCSGMDIARINCAHDDAAAWIAMAAARARGRPPRRAAGAGPDGPGRAEAAHRADRPGAGGAQAQAGARRLGRVTAPARLGLRAARLAAADRRRGAASAWTPLAGALRRATASIWSMRARRKRQLARWSSAAPPARCVECERTAYLAADTRCGCDAARGDAARHRAARPAGRAGAAAPAARRHAAPACAEGLGHDALPRRRRAAARRRPRSPARCPRR